jgi:hypothetical protein
VFDQYGIDRLSAWRCFRDCLESSPTPFEDVIKFWREAPFVGPYLNPNNPGSWPDPWQLIIDGKFDNLGLALAMLYTLKLTQRFSEISCELYTIESSYAVIVDNNTILNLEKREITSLISLENDNKIKKIWDGKFPH